VKILGRRLSAGSLELPNALSIHPMEGCDAEADGSPSDLTLRRYCRFAAGGAGMLWFEACAVVAEGKANPRQLQITQKNVSAVTALVKRIRREL
jgi:2,4-dienoyl-CoA reductase-like NADH-dependent reductase (Old Yellow Enzyme family)